MTDAMRDWPLKLRINAAAITLGTALYYARIEVYGYGPLSSPAAHWDALPMIEKREWIERAEDILRDLRPDNPTNNIVAYRMPVEAIRAQVFSSALTIRAVSVFRTREPHGSVCVMTFSDGRQLVSEVPGIEGKAYLLCLHHNTVRVRERYDRPNVLDRLESL